MAVRESTSVFVSSLTNLVALAVASVVDFPAVRYFCVATGSVLDPNAHTNHGIDPNAHANHGLDPNAHANHGASHNRFGSRTLGLGLGLP